MANGITVRTPSAQRYVHKNTRRRNAAGDFAARTDLNEEQEDMTI